MGQSRAAWRALAITLVAFVAGSFLDTWAYHNVRLSGVYNEDWGRLLRVMGFLPLWVLFGAFAVSLGIAIVGGGVLWLCPAIVLFVIVALAIGERRVGAREHRSNRTMNTPEPRG